MVVRGEDDLARLATSFNAMADSLQRQITQLEGLSQLQQRFTSDVSHELRTPLTTVQMAADVLHEARERLPAARGPLGGAAARRAGPVRGAAHRPAGDQPVRRRRRRARLRAGRPRRAGRAGGRPACASLAERHDSELVVNRPDERRDRRGRRPPGRADPAQPGRQRRSSTAPAGRSRSPWPPTATAAAVTVRDHGVGPELGRGAARLRPVLAGRPLAGAHRRRQRAGPVDQPRGRPAARRLAAGVGRSPAPARSSGSRCRWSPAATSPARRCRCGRPSSAVRGTAVMTPRRRRWPAPLAGAAAGGVGLLDGAELSSATVQITQAPSRPTRAVGIEPLPPEPGATPEEIVRGFIDAGGQRRARATRSPGSTSRPRRPQAWSDEAGITVLSPDYATVTTDAGTVAADRQPGRHGRPARRLHRRRHRRSSPGSSTSSRSTASGGSPTRPTA